jgi:excinuclease ABC subunit B
VLVTTLTQRMAEQLTEFYAEAGVRVRYLHSDIDTLERSEIIRDLRAGVFDVLVGINLLREGLDLPEVSLVLILDADKEGFLRAERSLIQTCGRAARNVNGKVIMYGDRITRAMQFCLDETARRRVIQAKYNEQHGIVPKTVVRRISDVRGAAFGRTEDVAEGLIERALEAVSDEPSKGKGRGKGAKKQGALPKRAGQEGSVLDLADLPRTIERLRKEMKSAATALEFEKAGTLRDRIKELEQLDLALR